MLAGEGSGKALAGLAGTYAYSAAGRGGEAEDADFSA